MIDIEHFAREAWTDPIRLAVRSRLRRLLDYALSQGDIEQPQVYTELTSATGYCCFSREYP